MADVITENTQLGATKNALIAELVQRELVYNAKLTGIVTDVTEFAVEGMKSIAFPKLTSFTVTNRAEGTKGEATALTASNDVLLLNQNAYVSYVIDKMTAKQSNIKPQMNFAKRAASAQARYIDEKIISTIRSGCSLFLNVGGDVDVTFANLLELSKTLEKNEGNLANAVWLCSVAQKYKVMALAEFKDAAAFGRETLISGAIGTILGMPVMVHNGLADKELFLVDKEAVAIGFQIGAEYGEQDEIAYGVGAKRAAIDQLFGTVVLQQEQKGAAAGKSPLIVGLND